MLLLYRTYVTHPVPAVIWYATRALAAGFGPEPFPVFNTEGLGRVISIATMFVFAITFSGVLQVYRAVFARSPARWSGNAWHTVIARER